MTGLRIDQAGVADLIDVMDVMKDAFDPAFGEAWNISQCEAMLSLPGSHLWIGRGNNGVAGFALSRRVLEESELLLIAVRHDARGQGIGRALLNAVTECEKNAGARTMFLEVRSGNPALKLYSDVGFVQVGSRPKYYRGVAGEFFDAQTHRLILD